jgi:hypothetical protein
MQSPVSRHSHPTTYVRGEPPIIGNNVLIETRAHRGVPQPSVLLEAIGLSEVLSSVGDVTSSLLPDSLNYQRNR